MYSTEVIKSFLEQQLSAYTLPPEFPGLYKPVEYILQLGGKRIRPLLTIMSANLFTDAIEQAARPALAMEVFHNFTLVHDDIMDAAPLRRGAATVHHKWDVSTAILSGDVMLIKAYELLADCNPAILADVLNRFNRTAREVCEGQRLDMDFETSELVTPAEYIEMIRLKTSVLLGCCCYTGALAGGASQSDAAHLYAFGESLGICFQLQDDILDTWGDSQVTGKQQGGDIIRNKKTYLLLKAIEACDTDEYAHLRNILHNNALAPGQKVKAVTALYEKKGVRQAAEREMETYFDKAIRQLKEVKTDTAKKIILESFARDIYNRKH